MFLVTNGSAITNIRYKCQKNTNTKLLMVHDEILVAAWSVCRTGMILNGTKSTGKYMQKYLWATHIVSSS